MKDKTFVLDTNVLIHKPDAFLSFKDCEVVIPLWVFEELDNLKRDPAGRGRSARQAIRHINEVAKRGDLKVGVKLESGGMLMVGLTHSPKAPDDMILQKMDNKIILCALELKKKRDKVFFVSKDINARIKASALGIKAVDYEKHKVSISSLYRGFREEDINSERRDHFLEEKIIETPTHYSANEYLLYNVKGEKTKSIGRYNKQESRVEFVENSIDSIMGVKPLNIHQRMAFDLLMDESISLVTLVGLAGTGKTLLALAAGLAKTMDDKAYTRVLLSRPVIPMGNDIGYLPGAKGNKMAHWMQPLFDNLEHIIDAAHLQSLKSIDQIMNNKIIEVEALTYIRGRSLPRQYIIIDEAQNLTPHEVKTIVSRAGEGTKVVMTGDPNQIDSPYLDSESNGLSYLVEAFRDVDIAGHMALNKSERSPLAELAAELL